MTAENVSYPLLETQEMFHTLKRNTPTGYAGLKTAPKHENNHKLKKWQYLSENNSKCKIQFPGHLMLFVH